MSYKFNPLVSLGLDQIASYDALNVLGTVANQAALPGGATTGDVYQAEDTGIFYVWDGAAWDSIGTLAGPAGPAGATGPAGADGADGADGQTILNGTVDPTDNVTGTDGDFYINTTSNEIFGPRTAGAWGSGTSLVGPAGGATTLGGLTDVDLTTSPPTNGEALVYDSVNSEWVPGSAGATAAGAANQIQYNDGAGGLAASSDFTVDPDWNDASTVFTGLKLNVTNTASAAGSKLLDLQSGGTSQFKITSTGLLKAEGQGVLPGGTESGLHLGTARYFALRSASTSLTSVYIQNSSASNAVASLSVIGSADAAKSGSGQILTSGRCILTSSQNTIEQENGTNAQTYRLYNTLTGGDVSATGNYERGFLQWNSNVLELGTEAGSGGGSERPVRITAATLKLPNLPTYADNAAATTGGLVAGDVYKTATGELRITV